MQEFTFDLGIRVSGIRVSRYPGIPGIPVSRYPGIPWYPCWYPQVSIQGYRSADMSLYIVDNATRHF